MSAYKIYKHLMLNNIFGINDKVKELRKNSRYANKNRKTKN